MQEGTAFEHSLCDAAEAVWRSASRQARVVRFTYRGRKYRSTLTLLAVLVEDAATGKHICGRYTA